MNDPGARTKGETIIERLKREKLEEENQASKSREEIDERKLNLARWEETHLIKILRRSGPKL